VDRKKSLIALRDVTSFSGFSLVPGMYPICYSGLRTLFGVSNNLLLSVQGTPKAPARPVAHRPSRIGIASELEVEICSN
jgi:hypothetical protein